MQGPRVRSLPKTHGHARQARARLPDGPVLLAVEEREDDLKLLAQVGAHEALHLHEQVVAAGLRRRVILPMSVLHLHDTPQWKRGEKTMGPDQLVWCDRDVPRYPGAPQP